MILSLVSEKDRKNLHPLEIVANRQWTNKSDPDQILSLGFLTNWLSRESGLERFHFDPLKMDVGSCTSIISYAYASRFNILPVEVGESEVVIAVTEDLLESADRFLKSLLKCPSGSVVNTLE